MLLIKCADIFVDGSVLISEYFRIPSFIIGITIVAMGTSAPEAAISITASIHSSDGIAVGNVIGSNIFNLLIVLGISALIRPLPVSTRILKVEYPLALLAAVMIPFLSNNLFSSDELILTRIDGILLLAVFIFFMAITVQSGKKQIIHDRSKEAHGNTTVPSDSTGINNGSSVREKKTHSLRIRRNPLLRGILLVIAGLAGIISGGTLVVNSASEIALHLGISQTLVGLTICAIGTSLPELVTSAVATYKGETDIAVGNVIGSNIFNILFVLSISAIVRPIPVDPLSITDSFILSGISLAAFVPLLQKKELHRIPGVVFIIIYAAYTVYIIMR